MSDPIDTSKSVKVVLFTALLACLASCGWRYESNNYEAGIQRTKYGDIDVALLGTSIANNNGQRVTIEGNPYRLFVYFTPQNAVARTVTMTAAVLKDVQTQGAQALPDRAAQALVAGQNDEKIKFSFSYFQLSLQNVKHDVQLTGEIHLGGPAATTRIQIPFSVILKAQFSVKDKNVVQTYWDALMGI